MLLKLMSLTGATNEKMVCLSQLFPVSHRFIRFEIIKHFDEIPCEG
jgi:hypothetical protein